MNERRIALATYMAAARPPGAQELRSNPTREHPGHNRTHDYHLYAGNDRHWHAAHNRTHDHRNRTHDHQLHGGGGSAGHHAQHIWPSHVDLRCLHGDQGDWEDRTVIVPAVYKEWRGAPPPWLHAQYPVYLYQRLNASKPCSCPNRGFESAVYFQFIAMHYARLPASVAFIQADWIFQTKTSLGRPFGFWQARCFERARNEAAAAPAQPEPLWRHWMPLGGRRSYWPPRCVIRKSSYYGRFVGRSNVPLIEACARELLRILDVPVAVRPYNRSRPLNLTFYTNMNFLVSRQRMRVYSHLAWRALARRFVDEGTCLAGPMQLDVPTGTFTPLGISGGSDGANLSALGAASAPAVVVDQARLAKWTLGMTTEFLQQSIFGFESLEGAPPPKVPADRGGSPNSRPRSAPPTLAIDLTLV